MLEMALQDIENGQGVCVIDPAGDLVKQLIHWIPENRVKDTIYISPDTPVPIDFLAADELVDKEALVGDLIETLEKSIAATRLIPIIRSLAWTLIDAGDCSFLDFYYFFTDRERQREIRKNLKDTVLINDWNAFDWKNESIPALLARLKIFVLSPSLRAIFGTPGGLNIFNAMNDRKILLVDLQTSDSALLLGQLLVLKICRGAFARRHIPKHERVPFFLYCDEFQRFQTSSFDIILEETGKFGLCLILANIVLDKLIPAVRSAIFGIVDNFIIFRLQKKDAKAFEDIVQPYETDFLTTLHEYQACLKVPHQQAIIFDTPKPLGHTDEYGKISYAKEIRKRSMDWPSCNTGQKPFNEVNGNANSPDPKNEEIKGTSTPPQRGKNPNPRNPR